MIKANLSHAEFEFVRISDLQTSVGKQSRRGQAEFRVFTRGRLNSSPGMIESWHRRYNLVVGFSGDRAACLESEPNQSCLDACGNSGTPWWKNDRETTNRPLASAEEWADIPRPCAGRSLQVRRPTSLDR